MTTTKYRIILGGNSAETISNCAFNMILMIIHWDYETGLCGSAFMLWVLRI